MGHWASARAGRRHTREVWAARPLASQVYLDKFVCSSWTTLETHHASNTTAMGRLKQLTDLNLNTRTYCNLSSKTPDTAAPVSSVLVLLHSAQILAPVANVPTALIRLQACKLSCNKAAATDGGCTNCCSSECSCLLSRCTLAYKLPFFRPYGARVRWR